MADNGATSGGIGAGLLAFTNTYMKAKQQEQDNAINQKYADMASQREQREGLAQGMTLGPDGQYQLTPEQDALRKAKAQAEAGAYGEEYESQQPGSDTSNEMFKFTKARMNQVQPGYEVPEGKSADFYKSEYGQFIPEQESFSNQQKVAKTKADEFLQGLNLKGTVQKEIQNNKGEIQKTLQDMKDQSNADKYQTLKDQKEKELAAQKEKYEAQFAQQSKEKEKDRQNALDKQALANQGKKKGPGTPPAQVQMDKFFAKDWNAYTNGGSEDVEEGIDKMKKAEDFLSKNPNATGPGMKYVPDVTRGMLGTVAPSTGGQEALKVKKDMLDGSLAAIKGLGRINQKEFEFALNQAWDDNAPAQQNMERIQQLRKKIEAKQQDMETKGSYFESHNSSLNGLSSANPSRQKGLVQAPQEQPKTIRMQDPHGKIRLVPINQKDAAIKAGGRVVQ
jgi:hypothetical protein